ncbi:hypothetical protein LTR56_019941 [Elasticomyces elasticus]|nr:hypothetical protein LTR22_025344 [Elasticomyces elasticus]KAK3626270.1 hypothetical protein LTR56_019941 [Elasticomyces elasticus]KAK4914000.1 hypothetical protein LTR49_017714 [Elasticomyces elasticus]KAK5731664.1 hypothetical protein LTS12_027234 [Elasticomyces elasticus]
MAAIKQSHDADDQPPCSQSQAGLLTIPPELRNRIYQLALIERHSGRSTTASRPSSSPFKAVPISVPRSRPGEPPLLRTCKLVRNEALAIYFGCNIFEFNYVYHVQPWIKFMGKTKAGMLRMVLVKDSYPWSGKSDDRVKQLLDTLYKRLGLNLLGLPAGVLVVNTGTCSEPRYINSLGKEVLVLEET